MKIPTDKQLQLSIKRVDELKPLDLITLLMQVRENLSKAIHLSADINHIRFIQNEILSQCKLIDEIDKNHPQISNIIHMLSLFILSICKVPIKEQKNFHLNEQLN